MLLSDPSLQIQKKVIQTSSTLYKEVVLWLAKSDGNSDENALMDVWNIANSLKTSIINLVDNDHDGLVNLSCRIYFLLVCLCHLCFQNIESDCKIHADCYHFAN